MNKIIYLWKKSPPWLRLVVLAAIISSAVWRLIPSRAEDLPSFAAQSGEFVIDLNETGRLRAEKSVTISAPPIRLNLQITNLVTEGTVVEKGDFLIQFDTTEINQQIEDQDSEIELLKSNLLRTLAANESHLTGMLSSVENSRASYRLAQLRLDQMKFEADVRIEEGRLNLLQAELALKQAEGQVESQKLIDSADVRSAELKIHQSESDLEKTKRDKDKLTVCAPAPGLVVFKDIWRGGEMSRLQVGDTPWRGQALVELPDLLVMLVELTVNEVEVSKVKVGQVVEVKLDAYPEPTFHGEVIEVSALARSDENSSDVKVFDVKVRLKESDSVLKPGMSARAQIIIERLPDKVWIPIEAVIQKDDQPMVWGQISGGWKLRPVVLGSRNDSYVIIETGLSAGARVALVDPTSVTKEQVTSKPKAPSDKPAENSSPRPRRREARIRG
ncbi:MAG: efflux RND transporter periplasmic adaptor subunit [Calditrichota bacterium]